MVNQNSEKGQKVLKTTTDECIYCGNELSKWESNRSYCWTCNELSSITYNETDTPHA